MGRTKNRADRIREEIPISAVLADLGYMVLPDAGGREQQFSCDLHGDGSDQKPSARCYPTSNSWYCFGCSRTRDAITTIMEKKGMSVPDACTYLEDKYGLAPLPWEEDEDTQTNLGAEIRGIMNRGDTFESLEKRIRVLLNSLWDSKEHISLKMYLGLWETFDMIVWHVGGEHWPKDQGKIALAKLHEKAMTAIKEAYGQTAATEDQV